MGYTLGVHVGQPTDQLLEVEASRSFGQLASETDKVKELTT